MKAFICLGLLGLTLCQYAVAGDNKKELLTLSNGKYEETFDKDSVEVIGNILYNVNTRKIIGFVEKNAEESESSIQPEIISRWLSIDPLAAKFPSMSPYNFCNNNPVIYTDPDGKNAVQVIDKDNKTITVTAVYYVQTQPSFKGDAVQGYSPNDLKSLNKIDDQLNKKNYTVTEGDYQGYNVKFDLQFKDGGTLDNAKELAKADKISDVSIGNTFTKGDGSKIGRFLPKTNEYGEIVSRVGGVTSDHQDVMMNSQTDQYSPRVHEIFHTFFFDRDNADNGIGAYYKQGSVNSNDINLLINDTPLLPKITAP